MFSGWDPDYAAQWRAALSFETRMPFYFLDPAFAQTGGGQWWRRRLRDLIDVVGLDAVSRNLSCIEYFPYKSTSCPTLPRPLPSQQHSFSAVRDAIRQGREIVVMRSERLWRQAVPELVNFPYIKLKNHQNPYFSRAQMTPDQFDRLCAALQR